MRGRGWIVGLALTLGWLSVGGPNLFAQGGGVSREYQLKAVFLYKICPFVEWPPNAIGDDSTFVIAVLGPNPFGNALETIAATEKVQGKKIVIRHFASAKDYQPCHVLFISNGADENADEKTAADRLKAVLPKTQGMPVLLVGDSPGFALQGGMVNFYIENNNLKLEINLKEAQAAGLKISARFLVLKDLVKVVSKSAASTPQGLEYHARLS
jgi:hypothetical protein